MYQDKEGFIWFATETGLSRFDGTHFKKFTVADGLPDNTVVRILEDAKGRIWIAPFTNSICYYYRGKIYNQTNDSLLKKIKLDDYVRSLIENKQGEVLIQEPSNVYQLYPNDSLVRLTPLRNFKRESLVKLAPADPDNYFLLHTYELYRTNFKTFTWLAKFPVSTATADNTLFTEKLFCLADMTGHLLVRSAAYQLDYTCSIPPANTLQQINDSIIAINTIKGTLFFNVLRGKVVKTYLPGKNISRLLTDREGGLWFATFNSGVYYLSSSSFKNIQYEVAKGQYLGVYDLEKGPDGIWAASDMGYVQVLRNDSLRVLSLAKQYKKALRGPVYCVARKGDSMAMGVDVHLYLNRSFTPVHITQALSSAKDIAFKNDRELMVAGSSSLYSIRLDKFVFEKFWLGRTTCLLHRNDSTWFGSTTGLYLLKPDKTIFYWGDIDPLLKTRISAIRAGRDGITWIATYNKGIVGLKDNKVKYHITEKNGLSSDACRCLAVDGSRLWAGTTNGLNRITLDTGTVVVNTYFSDGLAPDMINALLIDGDTVYAGTPQGITLFNQHNAIPASGCDFKMLMVAINGKEISSKDPISVGYGYNSIRLDFVAISYASAGSIVYTYRLKDLDTAWKTTTQTSLEFISLPPGEHMLEIYGTNKFGTNSNLYTLQIHVQRPFWQTGWFIITCIIAIIAATWGVGTYRNRQAREKEAARRALEQQLLGLEQKALRAQMNPHFIFNCMNSIQEFIIDKDVPSANKYLSKFAHLIRQTLENSLQSSITLGDEVQYLTNYLNLEQTRFKNMFRYTIHINPDIQPASISIPVMLLQPYVENAIRHGMEGKQNGDGQIEIGFSRQGAMLSCTIVDNGVGREAAGKVKRVGPVQYQSRGIQLTTERIALMNNNTDTAITVEIKDLKDEAGHATGTAVTVQIPITGNLSIKP